MSIETWVNKQSGQICLATPHWEPVKIDFDEKFYKEMLPPEMIKEIGNRRIAHGCLVQVGWLIQNQNGVWFGLSLDAKEHFDKVKDGI